MADVAVDEQWQTDAENVVEDDLKAIAASFDFTKMADGSPYEVVINGHGLDKNEGPDVSEILKFDAIGDNFGETTTNGKNEITHEAHASQLETGESSGNVGELLEEEIVELEFEKVKPKLETHSMHCPNCKSEITKVILRRKLYQSVREPVVPVVPQPEPQEDLVGCLSCLSLFTFSENGCFNPFNIFRKRTQTSTDSTPSPPNVNVVVDENESCFSMFWVIGKEKANNPKPEDPKQPDPVYKNREHQNLDQVEPPKNVTGTSAIAKGTVTVGNIKGTNNGLIGATRPSFDLPESSNPGGDDTAINIENEPNPELATVVIAQPSKRPWLGQDGLLLEILKSIVYGGLMEVIASLSVVASAAASDAATLSIVALALATLIGGVFVIGHNLWGLRDDCYKESSSQQKYKELLGEISYFPLHAFFAILSFLVFGMVPPAAYGYAFHETNDRDYTLVVVSIASLLCVALLAIFKAYINKCKVFDYFKTVVYYITTAVSVSGVSYVVGDLVALLMEEYGLFDTSSGGDMSLLTQATTSSFASF